MAVRKPPVKVLKPTVGLWRDSYHRYYYNGAGPFPSVTTILGIIDRPQLIEWAKRETARSAVKHLEMLSTMLLQGGEEATVAWLKQIPDYKADVAGDFGTRVHAVAEQLARGQEVALLPELEPYVEAYRGFLADHHVKVYATERLVFNTRYGYGGTYDLAAEVDGTPDVLLDIKSGRTAGYPEEELQLAGYRFAEVEADEGGPLYPIRKFKATAILHLRPDAYPEGYRLIAFSADRDDFKTFIAALHLYRWKKENDV